MPTPYRYTRPTEERSKASIPKCVLALFGKIEGGAAADDSLLNLDGWRLLVSKETEQDVVIFAVAVAKPERCDECGAPAAELSPWGHNNLTFFYDSPIRAKRTRLYYRAQRYRCSHVLDHGRPCGHTMRQPLPGIDERRKATRRLVEYLERELFRPTRTTLSLSDETGVPESSLRNIFTDRAIYLEAQRVVEPPRWLAIDEVNVPKKVYKHAYCVLSAPLNDRVVDILKDNKPDTLGRAILNLWGQDRHRIEVVSIDFWNGYRGTAATLLNGITIVIDRRHAQEMALRAFKEFVKDLFANKSKRWRKANVHDSSPLFKRYHELSREKNDGQEFSEKEFVECWLEQVPELKVGYWLKEEFCNLYELSSSEVALQRYDEWEVRAKAASPAFDSVAHTVGRWRAMVFKYNDYKDYFSKRVTNGPAEAVNRIIKRVRRLCVGIDFETLRAKLILGDFFVKRRPPHPLDLAPTPVGIEEGSGKERKEKREKKQLGPNANTRRLRDAREAKDKTKGLIQSPLEKDDYLKRVEPLMQPGMPLNKDPEDNLSRMQEECGLVGLAAKSLFKAGRRVHTTSEDSKQLEMFG